MCCHLYCLWFSDGQAWWTEILIGAIIPGILSIISSATAAYLTVPGVPDSKAHVCIDVFGVNSHLVQSQLKINVAPIITYTPLGGKELPSPNRYNTNSSRPEMPTKQCYSKKML